MKGDGHSRPPLRHSSFLQTCRPHIGEMGIFSASGEYAGSHGKKLNSYNLYMLLFVSIGSLCYGYTANVISATLAQPTFIEYFGFATRPNATAILSATNGVFQTGGVIGTLTLSYFSDRFGRKGGLAIVGHVRRTRCRTLLTTIRAPC
jgi:MFS family permease